MSRLKPLTLFFLGPKPKQKKKIHLLPTMLEVFRSQSASLLPPVLSDCPDSEPTPIPSSVDPDDLAIDRIQLLTLGPSRAAGGGGADDRAHLVVWNSSGTMAVYEAFSAAVPPRSETDAQEGPPPPRLGLRFVKTLVHHIPIMTPRRKGAAATNSAPPARRELVPFSTLSEGYHSGAFVTGEEAFWIVKGRQGPARCFDATDKGVYGFSSSPLGGGFATMTLEGLHLASIATTTSINHALPLTWIEKDRTYSYLTFDLDSGTYVAATLNETKFVAFDDEGNPVFKDAGQFTPPGSLVPPLGARAHPARDVSSLEKLLVSSIRQTISRPSSCSSRVLGKRSMGERLSFFFCGTEDRALLTGSRFQIRVSSKRVCVHGQDCQLALKEPRERPQRLYRGRNDRLSG